MPTRKTTGAKPAINQKAARRGIDVGPRIGQVSPVSYFYKHNHFRNEDEARGAFKLAHQQAMDGMGESVQQWMGLTDEQFDAWSRRDELPKKTAVKHRPDRKKR